MLRAGYARERDYEQQSSLECIDVGGNAQGQDGMVCIKFGTCTGIGVIGVIRFNGFPQHGDYGRDIRHQVKNAIAYTHQTGGLATVYTNHLGHKSLFC
jgi:hypothetical protein